MKRSLIGAVLLSAALVFTAGAVAMAGPHPQAAGHDLPGVAGIYQLQAGFHRAATAKDLDLMMSLWSDRATLKVAGTTYRGKDEIRAFFTTHPAFNEANSWVALTRSPHFRVGAKGDRGTLYFECYYVDTKTKLLMLSSAATTNLVRDDGRWLFEDFDAKPVTLAP
jgi:ketosteroid isomerase-like protein